MRGGDEAGEAEALRVKWDERYRQAGRIPEAAAVLVENRHLLPPSGRALDLACGFGSSAIFLARQGLDVHAWDLSPVAIAVVKERAAAEGVGVRAEVRDVLVRAPERESFDVLVVSHFLDRSLIPALVCALRPGGLLFYQTFTREATTASGPANPSFRLGLNELLRLFSGLTLRFYREEGRVGDLARGTRDLAQLVGQRLDG